MDDATLTVTLELRVDGDSLSGRATADDGEACEFDGWLGLLGGARRARPRHVRRDLREGRHEHDREATRISFGTLRRHLRGVPVIGPGEEGWDARPPGLQPRPIDQRPALIATPLDADDVAAVDRATPPTRACGSPRSAPATTPAPLGDLGDTILLKTDAAPGRQDRRREPHAPACARARSGRRSCPRASELGLAALHGSTPDVSVAGYSLGGGLGWYGRKHGLAANSVTAIELVTADGELRRVDAQNEPELFWALRGGGGNFGVVTALEFDLLPGQRGLRGRPLLPVRALVRGAARVARVVARPRPTRSPRSAACSSSRRSRRCRSPARPVVRGRRGRVPRHRGRRPRAARSRCATSARRWTRSRCVPPVGLAELHMDPPRARPVHERARILAGDLSAEAIDEFLAATGPGSGSPLV